MASRARRRRLGNDELQYYTDSTQNASLDGAGNLAIVARRADPQPGDLSHGGCGYTSARLITKDTMAFSYGLIIARLKLPAAPGCWSVCRLPGDPHLAIPLEHEAAFRGCAGWVRPACRQPPALTGQTPRGRVGLAAASHPRRPLWINLCPNGLRAVTRQ